MASDIKLDGELVIIDGNVGLGTTPSHRLDVGDRMRVRSGPTGTAGIWLHNGGADRGFIGMLSNTKIGLYGQAQAGWAFWMDTVTGNLGIGIGDTVAARRVHVEGSEVHSGGASGGFSFADRNVGSLVEAPASGQRWVWFAQAGKAVLWSGAEKLNVNTQGVVTAKGFETTKIKVSDTAITSNVMVSPPNNNGPFPIPAIYEVIDVFGELLALRNRVTQLESKVAALEAG